MYLQPNSLPQHSVQPNFLPQGQPTFCTTGTGFCSISYLRVSPLSIPQWSTLLPQVQPTFYYRVQPILLPQCSSHFLPTGLNPLSITTRLSPLSYHKFNPLSTTGFNPFCCHSFHPTFFPQDSNHFLLPYGSTHFFTTGFNPLSTILYTVLNRLFKKLINVSKKELDRISTLYRPGQPK